MYTNQLWHAAGPNSLAAVAYPPVLVTSPSNEAQAVSFIQQRQQQLQHQEQRALFLGRAEVYGVHAASSSALPPASNFHPSQTPSTSFLNQQQSLPRGYGPLGMTGFSQVPTVIRHSGVPPTLQLPQPQFPQQQQLQLQQHQQHYILSTTGNEPRSQEIARQSQSQPHPQLHNLLQPQHLLQLSQKQQQQQQQQTSSQLQQISTRPLPLSSTGPSAPVANQSKPRQHQQNPQADHQPPTLRNPPQTLLQHHLCVPGHNVVPEQYRQRPQEHQQKNQLQQQREQQQQQQQQQRSMALGPNTPPAPNPAFDRAPHATSTPSAPPAAAEPNTSGKLKPSCLKAVINWSALFSTAVVSEPYSILPAGHPARGTEGLTEMRVGPFQVLVADSLKAGDVAVEFLRSRMWDGIVAMDMVCPSDAARGGDDVSPIAMLQLSSAGVVVVLRTAMYGLPKAFRQGFLEDTDVEVVVASWGSNDDTRFEESFGIQTFWCNIVDLQKISKTYGHTKTGLRALVQAVLESTAAPPKSKKLTSSNLAVGVLSPEQVKAAILDVSCVEHVFRCLEGRF